jgi:hypothetical protein
VSFIICLLFKWIQLNFGVLERGKELTVMGQLTKYLQQQKKLVKFVYDIQTEGDYQEDKRAINTLLAHSK